MEIDAIAQLQQRYFTISSHIEINLGLSVVVEYVIYWYIEDSACSAHVTAAFLA